MVLILQSTLFYIVLWSVCCEGWTSNNFQQHQHQHRPPPSTSSSGGWQSTPATSIKPQEQRPNKKPISISAMSGCKPFVNNKPNFSQKPTRPQQTLKPVLVPSSNIELLKPIFSSWPGSINNQQQQGQSGWSHLNEEFLKPVFSAWPHGQQQQQQRPLIDVPFTVEIISNNVGWSK